MPIVAEVARSPVRIRSPSAEASSDTYQESDRVNLQAEVDELTAQIDKSIVNSKFNGVQLLDGSVASVSVQAGADSADAVSLTLTDLTTLSASGGSTGSYDLTGTDGTNARALLTTIDTELTSISTARATLGAGQSRLDSAVNTLNNNVVNLTDARSRIVDADYSAETTALAKSQILSQASTAMLAQANQSQQNVMSLLR